MRISVTIDFPCSDAEWQKLLNIRSIVALQPQSQAQIEELSDNEEKVLRQINGSNSETPLLDILAKNGQGNVNVSKLIKDHIRNNPGISKNELIDYLVQTSGKREAQVVNSLNQLIYTHKLSKVKLGEVTHLYLA